MYVFLKTYGIFRRSKEQNYKANGTQSMFLVLIVLIVFDSLIANRKPNNFRTNGLRDCNSL